jgi:hypothetical protein
MTRLLVLIFFFLSLGLAGAPAHAQLSQLEFDNPDDEVKPLVEKEIIKGATPGSIEEAEQREREAMELLLRKEREKNNPPPVVKPTVAPTPAVVGKADYKGLEVTLDSVPPEYRSLPPRIKGPFTDDKNESLITSNISWKSDSKGDCGKAATEEEYFKKALSMSQLLEKFSGTSDYYELLNSEVCQSVCDSEKEVSEISYMRLGSGATSRLIIPLMESNCRFQLEKDSGVRWLVMRVKSVTCSCFSKAVASKREAIQAVPK